MKPKSWLISRIPLWIMLKQLKYLTIDKIIILQIVIVILSYKNLNIVSERIIGANLITSLGRWCTKVLVTGNIIGYLAIIKNILLTVLLNLLLYLVYIKVWVFYLRTFFQYFFFIFNNFFIFIKLFGILFQDIWFQLIFKFLYSLKMD
jgi:hypothetical protein